MSASPAPALLIDDPAVLVEALQRQGWRVIGPQARDGAITYDPLTPGATLPKGLTDTQEGGHYRLGAGDPGRWFDYVVGPQSWKKHLFPSRQKLWEASRTDDGFAVTPVQDDYPKTAFFGVRACEIAAMEVQDRVFDNGDFADPGYGRRRAATLIVAVNCTRAAATCFCASMQTGPRAKAGFDIALTELATGTGLLVEVGSDRGAEIVDGLDLPRANAAHRAEAEAASAAAAAMQTRAMPPGMAGVLAANLDHPQWQVVADACLSCGNCTMACPTCFCSDVEDVNDLSGDHTERWRTWDSCFTVDFTYVHGGAVRRSTASRYRQWMTHKLSSWEAQFGTSGCVGCGRCIAWCPVGIDITAEAAAIAASPVPKE
ncbi:MAG: sulfite reductase subunit A [Limimaricola sp.]|uniref:4Fe-4S dicluster domain-containing protein n=1 Tax=Limimaricola sp. TaxID=2211665 RepID=UPI001D780A65|nr:4Fe-4S dicluster domain-containing protein [Limimaricola sp.]MBI1418149.1 sulfite reductase subunit A [Limimaricola sp.]